MLRRRSLIGYHQEVLFLDEWRRRGSEGLKDELKAIGEESKQMTDTNAKSEKTEQILLTGLTKKDMENLRLVSSYYPRIKNYGVLIRTVLKERAQKLPEEAQETLF
jgi:hypothetical protein